MKTRQFRPEQIVAILAEAEKGQCSVEELCRRNGISPARFYRWRNQYNGLQIKEIQRLKDLEKENARLKKLLAERDIEVDAMKEILSKKW